MDYSQLSAIELINLFLTCKSVQTAIRDELFGRYYERFDQRIRAVLLTCGLPYSPAEFYYNEIFVDLYHQVFDVTRFETILLKYELKKGEFAIWFLNYVIVNQVKDWLKRVNKSTGRKNIEWLRERVNYEQRQLALNEPTGKEKDGLTLAEIIPAETEQVDKKRQRVINSAIHQLPSTQQLMLRLLFIAYEELPEPELAHLAAEIKLPVSVVKERLEQTCQKLKNSSKYKECEKVELSLACLAQQENYLQKKLEAIESELEGLFPQKKHLEPNIKLKFKEIAQAKQDLVHSYRQHQIDEAEYRWRLLQLQRQYIAKQLSKTIQQRSQLLREYNSGKYFVCSSYKQLAQILSISEGTVASRINRTTSRLSELLHMEESGQKFRIKEVGELYQRGEEHVG